MEMQDKPVGCARWRPKVRGLLLRSDKSCFNSDIISVQSAEQLWGPDSLKIANFISDHMLRESGLIIGLIFAMM